MDRLEETVKRQNELCEQIDQHEYALLKLRVELWEVNREVKRLMSAHSSSARALGGLEDDKFLPRLK